MSKINLKDKYSDGEIDLSMCDLQDVPVKEIATFKKAYSLDLSSNNICLLPKNFTNLTHIVKLDLSKNELRELPEDFGALHKLKHLDLYRNKLQHLPLSFSKLKNLKWLDLKDNPLVPRVAQIAGMCLDSKECQKCARNIVTFYTDLEEQIQEEREQREKHRQQNLQVQEAAQKLKQQEKKAKKKNKNKEKAQEAAVQEVSEKSTEVLHAKSKSQSSEKMSNKNRSSCIRRIFIRLFIFLFISISMFFVFTSVDSRQSESILLYFSGLWNTTINKLPKNVQNYAVQTGHHINSIHSFFGNTIKSIFNNYMK